MSMGNLSRIKSGTRETDESIIKRLTDRLGMTFEDEGAYMFNNDYAEWQRRWRVIDAIECGRISEAGLLIDKYERMYGRKVVREQFAKVMRICAAAGCRRLYVCIWKHCRLQSLSMR